MSMNWFSLLFILWILPRLAFADAEQGRTLVHILEYLSKDYVMAVKDGKVISDFEYQEQRDFAKSALEIVASQTISPEQKEKLLQDLKNLSELIEKKGEVREVSKMAKQIQGEVLNIFELPTMPQHRPDLESGRLVFQRKCSECHGLTGDGNGPAAAGLNPPPANFLDETAMATATPFSVFNAIKLGVTGTSMPSFPELSEQEAWDVSYYVVSLRFAGEGSSYKWLAMATWYLTEAEEYYKRSDIDSAKALAVKAYLEGIEPVEPKINAIDPDLLWRIEQAMNEVRTAVKVKNDVAKVSSSIQNAKAMIKEVETAFSKQELTSSMAFASSMAILMREGFEAVLVILALLAILQAAGAQKAYMWVHVGWSAALFCGLALWWLSGTIIEISGTKRESMEALVSLLAVVVLLYVGFWLHSQTEVNRWKAFIREKAAHIMERKNLWSIAIISFLAVFREAFETVLFLRALWIEGNAEARTSILFGVATAVVCVGFLALVLFRFTKKLPIRQLFLTTSLVIAVLAVALAGKAVHAFQETGVVSVTVFPVAARFELLGVFPTYETLVSQLLVLLIVYVLWRLGNKSSESKH